jgi:hypothetical protein
LSGNLYFINNRMLNNLRFAVFLLTGVLILSCNINPQVKQVEKISEQVPEIPYDTITDDLVSYISGIANSKKGCLSKLDPKINWINYARELDSTFNYLSSIRFEKMKMWADSELINSHDKTTLFYPFSGPDFLNANIFYPDADQYIMIAMEPIGSLPDICNMPPDTVTSYLNMINNSLSDIYKRSYFITGRMNTDLKKTKVNGTIPLLTLFIKRTGHHIVSMTKIGVDSSGNWQIADSLKNKKNIVPGIKIDFLSISGKKVQSVFYFRTDISDEGLEKTPGFRNYLSRLPQSHTYLKAASYLMHYETFETIRSVVFDKSSTILQDDSGIAYKYFDKSRWDLRLYGRYTKPINEFSFISEPDLEKAYKNSLFRPLPYTLGYNWRIGGSSMLYAIKKEN